MRVKLQRECNYYNFINVKNKEIVMKYLLVCKLNQKKKKLKSQSKLNKL